MSLCIINDKKHQIRLANTPFVNIWLERYNNIEFKCVKKFAKEKASNICKLLEKHQRIFHKFGLNFSKVNTKSVWNRHLLREIHCKIVQLQKKYKKSTGLLNKNTQGDWFMLHELLHEFEDQLYKGRIEFIVGNHGLRHVSDLLEENFSDLLEENWSWEPILTQQQFMESSSFDRWHLNVPLAELGRYPYECFCHSPETWNEEGSMLGQISPLIEGQLSKTYPRPDKGYHSWCKKLNILPLGNNFPLANFSIEFPQDLANAETIRILK